MIKYYIIFLVILTSCTSPQMKKKGVPRRDADIITDYRVNDKQGVSIDIDGRTYKNFAIKTCKWQMGLGLEYYIVLDANKKQLSSDVRTMRIWCKHYTAGAKAN